MIFLVLVVFNVIGILLILVKFLNNIVLFFIIGIFVLGLMLFKFNIVVLLVIIVIVFFLIV